jgi:flagellar hook assembly protein FlgD
LPVAAKVRLEIFDLAGRKVRIVAEGQYAAGDHAVEWDKKDGAGTQVKSGVYIYRLTAGTFQAQRKMTLLP